jgi:hypothetical protein
MICRRRGGTAPRDDDDARRQVAGADDAAELDTASQLPIGEDQQAPLPHWPGLVVVVESSTGGPHQEHRGVDANRRSDHPSHRGGPSLIENVRFWCGPSE